jgi:hypothetical protein
LVIVEWHATCLGFSQLHPNNLCIRHFFGKFSELWILAS